MAATKSLLDCININAITSKDRLPDSIIITAESERRDLAIAAVEQHINKLEQNKKSVETQHEAHMQQVKQETVSGSVTDRAHDTRNELNKFSLLDSVTRNLVQLYSNISKAARAVKLELNERATIKHFNKSFNPKMAAALEQIFLPKEGSSFPYRHQDMVQYFPERLASEFKDANLKLDPTAEGNLDQVLKETIAATAYEWLGTDGVLNATGQTQASMRQLLQLEKDATIPVAAGPLWGAGTHTNSLAQALGGKILQRLSLDTTGDSDATAKARMELSLGFMAIAGMEHMKVVDRQRVHTDAMKAVAAGQEVDPSALFYIADYGETGQDESAKEGQSLMKFTKIRGVATGKKKKKIELIPSHIKEVHEHMQRTPDIFDKLFNNESDIKTISWNRIKLPSQRIGRTGEKANKKQMANLQKYTDIPYASSKATLGTFEGMLELFEQYEDNEQISDDFLKMLGVESAEGKLDVRKDSIVGLERGIMRDLEAVKTWINLSKESGNSEFFIPNKFMNNMRMLQYGLINPQNSKMHRNLFAPKAWSVSFKPNHRIKRLQNKEGLDQAFHEAIAFAFDIESGKVGGVDNQLEALDNLLNRPDKMKEDDRHKHYTVAAAVQALQEYDRTKKMTPEILRFTSDAVQVLDTKLHAFKGLVEYARYLNNKGSGKEFTTDIYKEIDGVSNGPIIGTMQMIPNNADPQMVLSLLAMGGISINPNEVNLDELLGEDWLNDAYQRMGQVWAYEIAKLKETADDTGKALLLDKANAIGEILGPFQEMEGTKKGRVGKLIRKLSKPRTMQTTYSAGIPKQMDFFANESIIDDGIYKHVENAMNIIKEAYEMDNREAYLEAYRNFEGLIANVNLLTGDTDNIKNYVDEAGRLDLEMMSKYEVESWQRKKIEQASEATYGAAMKIAINEVYEKITEARKPFSNAVAMATTMYNQVLKTKVNALQVTKRLDLINSLSDEKQVSLQSKITRKSKESVATVEKQFSTGIMDGKILETFHDEHPETAITRKELDKIVKEIDPLMPRIKTPLHTESQPSYLSLASVSKDAEFAHQHKVEQSYAVDGLPKHKAQAEGIPFLAPPGASAMVRSIQMIDSMVANHLMGTDANILNNHDGFSHGIDSSDLVREEANKRFHEIMGSYSLGTEFAGMFDNIKNLSATVMQDIGVDYNDLLLSMVKDGNMNVDTAARLLGWEEKDLYKAINAYAESNNVDRVDAIKETLQDLFKQHLADTDQTENVKQIFTHIGRQATIMAEETTANKNEIVAATVESAQYPDKGKGVTIDPAPNVASVFGIDSSKILDVDRKMTEAVVTEMQQLIDDGYGSTDETVSMNKQDYPDPSKVDSQNVSETFDRMVDLDNKAQFGSVQISDDHKAYLNHILDTLVSKVMDPIKVYIKERNIDKETMGRFVPSDDGESSIWIQTQKKSTSPNSRILGQGIRMSSAEVYSHEMVHHVTHHGLENSRHLYQQVYSVWEFTERALIAKYKGEAFRVFMNDPNANLSDPANAYEMTAAKDRWNYIFKPEKQNGKHKGIAEFIAIGLTNENFKRELATLTLEDAPPRKAFLGIFEKNVQQTIVNIYNKIMDFVHETFMQQKHSKKVDQELENLARALSHVDSKAKSVVYKAWVAISNQIAAVGNRGDIVTKKAASKAMSTVKLGRVIQKLRKLPKLDNMIGYNIRLALHWYGDNKEDGVIPAMVNEMKGTTKRLRPLHDLLNRRNRVIDAAKEDAATKIRNAVLSWFETEPTPEQKTAVTKAMFKTDFSSLVNQFTHSTLVGLVADEQQREHRIDTLVKQIANDPDLAPFKDFFEKAADDLGYYMVTSARRPGGIPLMNAYNIAKMPHTEHWEALDGKAFDTAVKLIDQLATISSLRYVNSSHKATLADMMQTNWEAMEVVMLHHNLVKADAFENSFDSNPVLMQKGYTKQILDSRVKHEQGTLADQERFEEAGFIMHKKPLPRDPADPVQEDIYIFTNNLGTVNDYQSGIASTTQNTGRGKVAYDIQMQVGNKSNPGIVATANTIKIVKDFEATLKAMFNPGVRPQYPKTGETYLIPKFDMNGDIIEARYMMSEDVKDNLLNQFAEFDAVLGAMTSQIIDKKYTPVINAELVTALKDMYDAEFKDFPAAYVEISPYSSNQRYRDIYHMLPQKTKQQVKSVWGDDRMYVSQDVVTLAFGQRKVSIIDIFAKDPKSQKLFERTLSEVLAFALSFRNPFTKKQIESAKGRTLHRAKRIEEFMTQLTKLGKTNIVVRNLKVTHGNYMSNIAYLSSKGLAPNDILKKSREAMNSALQYQSTKAKLDVLKYQREVTLKRTTISQRDKDIRVANMDRVITRLEDDMARNPSTALIEAGLMPQIVDDINTSKLQSPYKYGLEKGIEDLTAKLPEKVGTVAKTLFMTEDTEGFRMMNNAVKMTDYVGRYVLYHHYTTKKGMSHKDAVSAVTEEFINFSLPTHKMIEYGNSVGLIWFSKYQLRVLKQIKNLVKDYPFTTLATFILGSFVGNNNILNSVPGVTKDAMQAFDDPLSTFVGTPGEILYADMAGSVASAVVDY